MKTKLCILFGGRSSEHEVSLSSAFGVLSNLDPEKYDVTKIGITKEGKWYLFDGDIAKIKDGTWCNTPDSLSSVYIDPAPNSANLVIVSPDGKITEKRVVDVVFPVLHGAFGEDGTLQGLLSLAGIKYVGPKSTSSGVCMDKAFTKQIVADLGIRQADAVIITKAKWESDPQGIIDKTVSLGYPVFVKPSRAGSSVGVSKVKKTEDLSSAVEKALKEDSKVLVEEYIKGRETEVAVMETEGNIIASVPGEIDPGVEFYDYETKYVNDTASYYIPARLTDKQTEYIKNAAVEIFAALDCKGLSRVDFFTCDNGEIVFNEINTLPGFTPISMYPKLFMHTGITYGDVVDKLIESALLGE